MPESISVQERGNTWEWAQLRRGRQGTNGRATKLKRAQQHMQERAAEYTRWGQSIKAEAK